MDTNDGAYSPLTPVMRRALHGYRWKPVRFAGAGQVMTYEVEPGDERESDKPATLNRMDIFPGSMVIERPKD